MPPGARPNCSCVLQLTILEKSGSGEHKVVTTGTTLTTGHYRSLPLTMVTMVAIVGTVTMVGTVGTVSLVST